MGVLAIFDDQGQWGDTLVCDAPIAARLAEVGWTWGPAGSQPPAGLGMDVVRDSVRLFYLRADDGGHRGVLCESGEWIAPAANGETCPALAAHAALHTAPGLPSQDDFIDTMLALTGHAGDEEDED